MISGFDFGCTEKKGTNPPKRNERYVIFAITKVNTCSSKWLQSSSLCKQAQPACLILFFQPSPAKIRGLQHADLSSSLLVCSGGAIGPPWAPPLWISIWMSAPKKNESMFEVNLRSCHGGNSHANHMWILDRSPFYRVRRTYYKSILPKQPWEQPWDRRMSFFHLV